MIQFCATCKQRRPCACRRELPNRPCRSCGEPLASPNLVGYCSRTPKCRSLYQAAWHDARRPQDGQSQPCKNCGLPTTSKYGYCKRTKECLKFRDHKKHLATYVPVRSKCVCCGNTMSKQRTSHGVMLCSTCDPTNGDARVLKMAVMMTYGNGACSCCGEDRLEFLSVDHIDGDGADHRRELFREKTGGMKFYRYLRANGWPYKDRLAVLCMNCNKAKYLRDRCPCDGGRAPKLTPEIPGQLPLF